MANVEFFTLGEFKILSDGVDVTDRLKSSKKKLLLLEFLLINKDTAISNENLIKILWNSEPTDKLITSLKTLVSRLRKDLFDLGLEDAILTKHRSYMWNPELDSTIDIFNLENLCNEIITVRELNEANSKKFEEILLIYNDDLLKNIRFNSWSITKAAEYQQLFLNAINSYAKLLISDAKYSDVIRVCQRGLHINTFDVSLNIMLMTALMKIGKQKEALAQYQNMSKLHFSHFGVKPDEELLNFYQELLNDEPSASISIKEVSDDLHSDSGDKFALVCEYSIFKDIYTLYVRNFNRSNIELLLCMVSLTSEKGSELDPMHLDGAMEHILNILKYQLRVGDTISRYSPTQFAVLLPSVSSEEQGHRILERLLSRFDNAKYPGCTPKYSLLPLKLDEHEFENQDLI